ncbi:MAG: abortive phage infection protein [Oscillospiraceae bacterium]|nr:abortive phage infection protein [Oscillospiraceae bacterium]
MCIGRTINDIMMSSSSGVITSKEVTAAGIHRSELQKLVKNSDIYRFGKGLYVSTHVWEDDFYLLQQKYRRGIYSHDTALYLLGYSDRTPAKYTMTFPKGYNCPSLKQENILVKRVIPENYDFGVIEAKSPNGNTVRVYDLEKTLCDILRGNDGDIQIITSAMKRYANSKERDIHKLLKYAERLRVKPKVLRYMEVLL